MLETVERSKLRDVVAERLKTYISEENLKPGDRLPTETELANRFGVSRLSLREATKSLEFIGILDAKPGRGLIVGSVNMNRVTEFLGFHPVLQDVPAEELIDSRVVLETGILKHVARRMRETPELYRTLLDINNELRHARTIQRFIELDISFHKELIGASGLSPLMAFSDLLAVFFQRFRESVKKAEWQAGIQNHQQIIDALRKGDVPLAERLLRNHIESHRERIR